MFVLMGLHDNHNLSAINEFMYFLNLKKKKLVYKISQIDMK